MRGDDGVGAACDQRGHVEGGPDRRPAAGDGLAAALDAAVAIDGGHADKGCDLAPVEAPEFRKLSDEGAQCGLAHARHAGQKVGVGLPGGAFSDRAVDVAIELGKFDLEKIDMPIDGLQHARLPSETTAVFLRHDHLDDLPPARHKFAQRLGFGVRDRPRRRANGLGEVGDRRGVQAIGLSELSGRAGKISDLTRIDHRQGQMRGGKGACDHCLVPARRLERDEDGSKSAQAFDKTLKTFVVARDNEGLSAWADADVQPILRHVDPNEHIHLPSLHMRARDAAPATVRDVRMDGWGARLRNGLRDPGRQRAPIRRRDSNLTAPT